MSSSINKRGRYIVAKFGGSSLADESLIARAAEAVAKLVKQGTRVVVVVSAMGKTTDDILETVQEACIGEISGEELDDIVSMGERTSIRVFSAALQSNNIQCRYLDPADVQWPIITDNSFTNANPIVSLCEELLKKHVLPLLQQDLVVVIPGFIGKTRDGKITTLGRGGSDTTAFIVAKALSVDQVVLVTNVDGIMTADPKIIKNPSILRDISVDALTGLADSGTKFIHKKALTYKDPTIEAKVINNRFGDLDADGTLIYGGLPTEITVDQAYSSPVMAITVVGEDLAESPQLLLNLLQQIKQFQASILGVSINHNSIILYLPENSAEKLLESIHQIVVNNKESVALAVRKNLRFLKVKGVGLEETPGIISKLADSLYSAHINIFGMFTITSSVLVFVDFDDGTQALTVIRNAIGVSIK